MVENPWGNPGGKRIKMKTITENITGARVCGMRIVFNLRHKVQFFSHVSVRTVENASKQ